VEVKNFFLTIVVMLVPVLLGYGIYKFFSYFDVDVVPKTVIEWETIVLPLPDRYDTLEYKYIKINQDCFIVTPLYGFYNHLTLVDDINC